VFVQWLAQDVFPESTRVLSDWTAGPGQSCFGSDSRQRTDALICLPVKTEEGYAPPIGVHLMFVNYHGQVYHGNGGHQEDCPRADPAYDGLLDDGAVVPGDHEGGDASHRRKIRLEQDKRACHRFRPQTLYWPGSGGTVLSEDRSGGQTKDQAEDKMKERLAAAMTAAARAANIPLTVSYRVVHECQLFHNFRHVDGRKHLGVPGKGPEAVSSCIRQHLKLRHGGNVVFGPPPFLRSPFTQETLVSELLSSTANSDGGRLGGFLLLRGGRLNAVDDNMGYCLQRLPTHLSEVGCFTRWQASRLSGGDEAEATRLLRRYCDNELTVARRSFPDSGELVGADLFRWLVREKGLCDYEVKHFIYYEHADYLTHFFERMAQRRHELQRTPGGPGGVEEQTLKQICNSAYGHSCMQASHFTTTSVVSDVHMKKTRLLDDPRVSDVTLLGATLCAVDSEGEEGPPAKKRRKHPPRLLFAVTRANPDAKIVNILQLAASVLSNSRVLFLGAISRLLCELLDPRCAEMCYTDTDSVILTTAFENLEDCLRPGVDPGRLRELLVDTESPRQQGGRFKLEGTFTAGLFRSSKCYFLRGKLDQDESSRRMRSVARRTQRLLEPHHFGQNPDRQGVVVGNVALRPTKAFQMTLQEEYQRTTHGFNFQRRAHVSADDDAAQTTAGADTFFSLR